MRILSGIKPSGELHIGNYFGAIKQLVDFINTTDDEVIVMIADLHAITVYQDPQYLKERIYELAALYFASGIDYNKAIVFVQSDNPDHPYLAWLFDTVTPYGWLTRMTQFKDKRQKLKNYGDIVSVGLFNYPVLMAADILIYDTDLVPVGEDQVQHVELARDIAKRFNKLYGETFKVPEYKINKTTARIMDLQVPTRKMSKSEESTLGCVFMLDPVDVIVQKFKKAVTDSGHEIKFDKQNKPGISNLMAILSAASGKSLKQIEEEYAGVSYAQFKQDVAEAVVEVLRPIQQKAKEFLADPAQVDAILHKGAERARELSYPKLLEVLNKMGLYHHG